jgi:hypothetical protein
MTEPDPRRPQPQQTALAMQSVRKTLLTSLKRELRVSDKMARTFLVSSVSSASVRLPPHIYSAPAVSFRVASCQETGLFATVNKFANKKHRREHK